MINREDLSRPLPRRGQKFRHFKGDIYQIASIARHTESNKLLVIYRRAKTSNSEKLQEDYARPLEMFMSKVDKSKYPDSAQIFRFELIS